MGLGIWLWRLGLNLFSWSVGEDINCVLVLGKCFIVGFFFCMVILFCFWVGCVKFNGLCKKMKM